jgi:hypothetical protein
MEDVLEDYRRRREPKIRAPQNPGDSLSPAS